MNESFALEQIASIRGPLLRFDEEDSEQGIFFIDANGVETRVENVAKNKSSELLFFVPESLTSGSFQVEVRTRFHNSKILRKNRFLNDLVPIN